MVSKEQLKNLLEKIENETGLGQEDISLSVGYRPRTLTELLSKGEKLDSAYNRLVLKYGDGLKNSMLLGKNIKKQNKTEKFTADQLFAMYMKSAERQDRIMEAQTVLLTNIQNKMAQEKTQAMILDKLKEVDSNLKKGLKNQNWASGLSGELLIRDVQREADGNQEKEKQILAKIVKKIGPDLPTFLKTGKMPD